MQAVMQIAASCHTSAGAFVIGQMEIPPEVGEVDGKTESGASVGFVAVSR